MKRRWFRVLLAVLLTAVPAVWFADRELKKRAHPGLRTFISQWWVNYPKSFAVEAPLISIAVDDAAMEQLSSVVDDARALGVIEREGNDFVSGAFEVVLPNGAEGSGSFKGKLRIKGKMADHVEGSKWSFRVVAKKGGGFLGMRRFSLQHPGTRNYLTDWFFHQLMAGEGLVALRYGFCRVRLNDESLGVYAYEEHFGPELLENNGRLEGPILRFDPSLFWLHRIQGLDGSAKVDDAYGAYQAASLDAFGRDDIAEDPKQKRYFEQAIALVNAFRRGELKASDVFHADRIAIRLALLDVLGGHRSIDWSDVKFYYDPVSQRIEPISYESVSGFRTKELAGAYKFTGPFRESDELHAAFLKDPVIFAAYVRHLERFSQKAWLDSAFTALSGALDTASATLYGEFPYKELDRSIYYANQKAIRTLLDVPKGFHAYREGRSGDTLNLTLVPIESLPMQVDSVILTSGERIAPVRSTIVPSRERGKTGRPTNVAFLTTEDSVAKVIYHVLGSSVRKTVDVFPFKLSVSAAQDELLVGLRPNAAEFPFLVVDEAARTITIKPGVWTIDRTLVLPAGYRCSATAPLRLNLVNGAELISYAALDWRGLEEDAIQVFSADSSSRGVHVIDAVGRSVLGHVAFRSLTRYAYDQPRSGDVSFHRSDAALTDVLFSGTGATLLDASLCTIALSDCRFEGGSDQAEFHFAEVDLRSTTFHHPADDAVSVEGGAIAMQQVGIIGRAGSGIAVKGSRHARITANGTTVERMKVAFEGREGAKCYFTAGSVKEVDLVAEAKKHEMRYGPVRMELNKVSITNAKEDYKKGEDSILNVDGKAMEEKSPGGT